MRSRIEAVPALVACVAIAFAALAAERKLSPPAPDAAHERRAQPLVAPAPLARVPSGERR
jgi:hypothetical protein